MLIAFTFTALAGAATALGGLAAVHQRVRSETGLAAALGFAAGAMLLVSAVEIIPKGADGLVSAFGPGPAWGVTLLLVAIGSGVTAGLQRWASGRHQDDGHRRTPETERLRLLRSGVVVAPLLGAGVGRDRAVAAAALSGLAEPVGAVLGYLLLLALLPAAAHAMVFGLVAGVMLHISVTELLPSACRLATVRTAALASTAGAGTMALSLGLLGLA